MKRKIILCALMVFSASGWLTAQKMGVITMKDSSIIMGQIYFDKNRPDRVGNRINKEEIRIHSAAEVSEFYYNDSSYYHSRFIDYKGIQSHVLLELIEDGNVRLYETFVDEKIFVIESDKLIVLDKGNFRESLASCFSDCPKAENILVNVAYRRLQLASVIKQINSGDCSRIPFPNIGIGLALARSKAHSNLGPIESELPDAAGTGYFLSLFYESPVWFIENASIINEFGFSHQKRNGEEITSLLDRDIYIETSSLYYSPQLKYAFNRMNSPVYLLFGGKIEKYLSDDSVLFTMEKSDERIEITRYEQFVKFPGATIHADMGIGFQFFYQKTRYSSIEMKYSRQLSAGDIKYNQYYLTCKFQIL